MQKSFEIKSNSGNYLVNICKNILDNILDNHGDGIIICDEIIANLYLPRSINKIIKIKAREESKDLRNISSIILELKKNSLTKDGLIIAIGGGVIQDIACFVASIYMRGIKWIYFPTTFLGMVDSCIGGKSSINVEGIKNLVGNFYPPQSIYVDSIFLPSLSKEQMLAGCCEAIKICYAYPNRETFDDCAKLLLEQDNVKNLSEEIIILSLNTKKWFIEKDEFDLNERQLLNFGHTFGHAIEGACQYEIPHGIAVGFGMMWAIFFAEKYFGFNSGDIDNLNKLKTLLTHLLSTTEAFSEILIKLNYDDILIKFNSDKKHKKDHYSCILPNKLGILEITKLPKTTKLLLMMRESFEDFINYINEI